MTATPSTSELGRGWLVIIACALGVGLGNTGLAFYSMTLFIAPLSHDFGWTRGQVSGASFCLLIGTIVTSPFVGRLIDRFGAMRLAMTSMSAVAIGFAALSYSTGSLVQFYATWLFISFFGTGTTPVVWTRTVNLWFRRHLGLALAITLCGTGVVAMVAPSLLNGVMAHHGWRSAYLSIAAFILVIGMPTVYLLLRGKTQSGSEAAASPQRIEEASRHYRATGHPSGATFSEAVRTLTFWQMAIGIALASLVIAGLAVHMVPMMVDSGLPRAQAAANMGLLGVAIIVGRLSIGVLLDQLSPRVVSGVALMLPALTCLMMSQHVSAAACVVVLGLSAGAEVDLLAFLVRRYFGMTAYAAIYGCLVSCFSLGASIGPMLAGHLRDIDGNYETALYGGAIAAIVGALLFGTLAGAMHLPAPKRSTASY